MLFVWRLALVCTFLCGHVFAQISEKTLQTRRATGTIRVDGRLDDPDWQDLPVATGFVQTWPELGYHAALRTEVKVLYDNNYLYVGARMHHPPGKASIVKRVHRRDQESSSDWFGVYIDSFEARPQERSGKLERLVWRLYR